ncbi:VOC family protein [Conexibacter sp. W3-3-2]|uniref:VOC family protein n=1 Tax=Conexibacter sp. W3-3-2 TaxID=2675227 RepID=UPI0012B84EFE|nr:VOC family protein [Conexibacter sp. W3-3-2]MTD46182.1 VOC family protein [Conexibacter sp. W3-3-2]
MQQRVSLITLGVPSLPDAVGFYERLGWTVANDWRAQDVAFVECGGMAVALWSRAALAADSCVEDGGGWGGVTLAYNVRSPQEVDAVLEEARAAGATVRRAGAPTPWGGYSGVFLDVAGHPWEVAHNPFWALDEDGAVTI